MADIFLSGIAEVTSNVPNGNFSNYYFGTAAITTSTPETTFFALVVNLSRAINVVVGTSSPNLRTDLSSSGADAFNLRLSLSL